MFSSSLIIVTLSGAAVFSILNPLAKRPSDPGLSAHGLPSNDNQTLQARKAGAPFLGPILTDWNYQVRPTHRGADGRSLPSRPPANPAAWLPEFEFTEPSSFVPMPQPGAQHGLGFDGWMSWAVNEKMQQVVDSGAPVGFLLRNRNVPFPYHTEGKPVDPNALNAALNSLERLDYVFMDLEFDPAMVERNVNEVVRIVREHPNPRINQAYIGNYEDYPGIADNAQPWGHRRDRSRVQGSWDRDKMYTNTGMNVAMPAAYPYESYSVHADSRHQRLKGSTPNLRSAMVWAPIERVSEAKRNLPEGHLLVPWVTNFVKYSQPDPNRMYFGPPPPVEDLAAIISHIRLRGANGFVVWTGNSGQTHHPSVDYTEYRQLTLDTWRLFDKLLPVGTPASPMNLVDAKTSGIIWSGMITAERAVVLVSNLSGNGAATQVKLPPNIGLPEQTESVEDGAHRLFVYELSLYPPASDPGTAGTDSSDARPERHEIKPRTIKRSGQKQSSPRRRQ